MIAVDTNILVYAEIVTSARHAQARALLRSLAEGAAAWAIPWPCAYEFLRVVTHPRVFDRPVPAEVARRDLLSILGSPSLRLLAETGRHAEVMDAVLRQSAVAGNLVHDAHIAALCLEHGVSELVTGDRDFGRFEGLRIRDPFR
ncbi:MAG: TA system VapC family ribonuclease toxin [Gemmatimonadales bacterium]